VFDLASGQAQAGQVGILGENAFFQEAVLQFKVDTRVEVFQVEPARDPGPPKPQPMRVGVGHQPPTQDVAEYQGAHGVMNGALSAVLDALGFEVSPFGLGGAWIVTGRRAGREAAER
jgi:hypothetical protein